MFSVYISQVLHIVYLLQIFYKAIIQHNDSSDKDRPCRPEIHWHGATDSGFHNVRNNVHLWGLYCEMKHHAEIWAMDEHKNKTATEISELVNLSRYSQQTK